MFQKCVKALQLKVAAKTKPLHEAFMKARRLVPLIGSVLALLAMVAWIGEIDLGLDESLQTPPTEQS